MIGQLILTPKGRGKAEPGRLYGLRVLRVEADRSGFWGERRLRRAARALRKGRARRVLVPRGFSWWPLLEGAGLRPVDPEPFVQAQAVPLALGALERQGLAPDRATVALRGVRADRALVRTAEALCPQVRGLVIDAPRGGTELALRLRREFGIPVLPAEETGQVALAFQPGCLWREETCLELWGPSPSLDGLVLSAPDLAEEDRTDLPLLAALWEAGLLEQLKIT